ncbi:3-carboxy-cis,cis-muconate cycloisomerase [Roseibium album]|nr:3-carboxy-cis,cis-muconate cycloisomerase [Roseibium album]
MSTMPVSLFSSAIYSGLFADDQLVDLLDDASDIAAMVAFERALAKVQGELGVIPAEAAQRVAQKLDQVTVDPVSLKSGTQSAGIPVPALVSELRNHVGDEDGQWIHWGATSQDVMDTAQVLQTKACLDILEARLRNLVDRLEAQSNAFSKVIMAGRTRSQISTPITLGYRIAQWAHPLIDAEAALSALKKTALIVQFGGASGINGAIAPNGSSVSSKLAEELGLQDSPSWHSNRSSVLSLAAWLQQICAALAKMAGDLVLMGRTDIAEVSAGIGGGSSTMPQKANPVQAETILVLNQIAINAQTGLATAASPVEERDGAKWPLEWMFLPQMLIATGVALRHAQVLADSIQPNPENLKATLAANPEIMAEAASFILAKNGIARTQTKELVAKAAASDRPFADALGDLSTLEIDWQAALDLQEAVDPSRAMSARIFARRQLQDEN